MSREIKFRAWDLVEHKFVVDQMPLSGLLQLQSQYPDLRLSLAQWQEYTGLKDKNGKEIYEGDILHYSQWTEPVRYIESYFAIFEDEPLYPEQCEESEVIGNIYENPALLESGYNPEALTNRKDLGV